MRALEDESRRSEQLLEVNSLVVSARDPVVARARILEYVAEEVGHGLDDKGERHIRLLYALLASAERQRLEAKTEQELADMFDLYRRTRRELREADDSRPTADILARSIVPALADVCLVDLAEGRDAFRRVAVETSHLVPNARPIKTALSNLPDNCHAPHDPQLVARTGTTHLLAEVSDADLVCASSTPEHLQALRSLNPTSYLCVPVESSDSTVVGAMTLLRVRPGHTFSGPHKRLAEALGEMYQDADAEPRVNPTTSGPSRDHNGTNRRHEDPSRLGVDHLTRRELEVLKLLNQGYSRESLAKRLNISVKTYDNHTLSIRAKLDADNNLAALVAARASRILLGD